MGIIVQFLASNWVNLLLVAVGSSALIIYLLQEQRKKVEAASLIVLQIDELQDRLRELSTYLVDSKINSTAFYESLPLMEINYWNQFKHYFVRKMDQKSFSTLNLFYDYVCEIQEQQLLLKQLQKNSFFQIQNILSSTESQLIANGLGQTYSWASPAQGLNIDQFWNIYKPQQDRLKFIINQNALTEYTPVQIRISMEKKLREYTMLEILGTSGYQLLKKISKRI